MPVIFLSWTGRLIKNRFAVEVHVVRRVSAISIFMVLAVTPAFGQYVSVIQACSRDLTKFCSANQPDGARLSECTETHFQSFSASCQTALAKIAAVREACRLDVQQHCRTRMPGAGRILLCMKKHFAALSEPCRYEFGRAAERKIEAH